MTICGGASRLYLRGRADTTAERHYRIASGSRTKPSVWKCAVCGHGWTNDRPEHLADWYSPYDHQYMQEAIGRRHTNRQPIRRAQRYAKAEPPFLDVGSGPRLLVAEALQMGLEAYGTDTAQWAIAAGTQICGPGRVQAMPVAQISTQTHPQIRSMFALDLIEHLPDPHDLLRRAAEILPSGGALTIVTPRLDSLLARLLGHAWYCIIPSHLHYFSRRSLHRALHIHGFSVVHTRFHVRHFSLAYLLARLGLPQIGHRILLPVCLFDALEVHAKKR